MWVEAQEARWLGVGEEMRRRLLLLNPEALDSKGEGIPTAEGEGESRPWPWWPQSPRLPTCSSRPGLGDCSPEPAGEAVGVVKLPLEASAAASPAAAAVGAAACAPAAAAAHAVAVALAPAEPRESAEEGRKEDKAWVREGSSSGSSLMSGSM